MKDGQPQRTPTRGQSVLLRTSPEGSVDLSPFPGRSVRWLLEDRVETNPVGEFLVWVPLDGGATQRWTYRTFLYEVDKRSEEHTSELQSLMRISYAVFCLKKTK